MGELRAAQCGWVGESLRSEGRAQMREWVTAITVGVTELVEKVTPDLGIAARHRDSCVGETSVFCVSPKPPTTTKPPPKTGVQAMEACISGMKRGVDQGVAQVRPGQCGSTSRCGRKDQKHNRNDVTRAPYNSSQSGALRMQLQINF